MSNPQCKTCKGKEKGCKLYSTTLVCKHYKWNNIPYQGENEGKKCMRCTECGKIYENTLWYSLGNSHFCPECNAWRPMINLDNEEFNPSRR